MSRRILIVPDKFKWSLSALEAAGAIARGWAADVPGRLAGAAANE